MSLLAAHDFFTRRRLIMSFHFQDTLEAGPQDVPKAPGSGRGPVIAAGRCNTRRLRHGPVQNLGRRNERESS